MAYEEVLDLSNYSGVPSNRALDDFVYEGYDSVILGTQIPTLTIHQYEAIKEHGGLKIIGLYVFVYWDAFGIGDDSRRIKQAIALAERLDLPVWLDCEWVATNNHLLGLVDSPMLSESALYWAIAEYRDMLRVANCYAGIYTGRWWWPRYMGEYQTSFSGDPLWHADYIAHPPSPEEFDKFRPYGGWTRPLLWQWSSEGPDGFTADQSIMEVPDMPILGPSQDQLRLAAVQAMLTQYDFKVIGQAPADGHYIVQLLHKDGTSEAGAFIALYL